MEKGSRIRLKKALVYNSRRRQMTGDGIGRVPLKIVYVRDSHTDWTVGVFYFFKRFFALSHATPLHRLRRDVFEQHFKYNQWCFGRVHTSTLYICFFTNLRVLRKITETLEIFIHAFTISIVVFRNRQTVLVRYFIRFRTFSQFLQKRARQSGCAEATLTRRTRRGFERIFP